MTKPHKPKRWFGRKKPEPVDEDKSPAMSLEQIMGGDPDKIRAEAPPRPRLTYLDAVRGLVIVLMAIDHARDFWTPTQFQPTDFAADGGGWQFFFTRWITHLCAPTFVLLAGMGAWLWKSRGRSRSQLSMFLLTRGCWLIFIEFVVISIWWQLPFGVLWKGFDPTIMYPWSQVSVAQFPPPMYMAQVIWAIGASMILLAGLIWIPIALLAPCAVTVILGHNLLDPHDAQFGFQQLGQPRTLLEKLHGVAHTGFGAIPLPSGTSITTNRTWMNVYPLVPWFAVLALGYSMGPLTQFLKRRKAFLLIGLGCIAVFAAVRYTNVYGDPDHWEQQKTTLDTVMSFINVQKYPPSALYLLCMLGIGMVLLATIDLLPTTIVWILTVYGRVPFLFYVLHLPVLWLSAAIMVQKRFGDDAEQWALSAHNMPGEPQLWWTYAAWFGLLVALFPVCYAFGRIKQNSKAWWLSYL